MAIVFPTSPTLNEEFTADNKTWIWDGEKWVFYSVSPETLSAESPVTYSTTTRTIGINQSLITIAQSQVTGLSTNLSSKANIASPTFTGTPAAPTAISGTNTTQIATTAFVTEKTNVIQSQLNDIEAIAILGL